MSGVQIAFAVLFVAACLYTVAGYPSRYGALSGRSRLFRTAGLFLLDLFLGLVLLYTFLDFRPPGANLRVAAFREITYLLACVFLGLALLSIAILDWLESYVVYRRAQRDLIVKTARDEAERIRQREKTGSGDAREPEKPDGGGIGTT